MFLKHEKDTSLDFSIPTGNFGDIFAGFIAKKMLPAGTIRQLILATNSNDILTRFVNSGDYSLGEVKMTSSPSMDIQAASNFERYLYYLLDKDSTRTAELMGEFAKNGALDLSDEQEQIRRDFTAVSVTEEDVLATISDFYKNHGYVLDPHTAVGVKAAEKCKTTSVPMVCLATAHPAKFSETVSEATGAPPPVTDTLAEILEAESRCKVMVAKDNDIRAYIAAHALKNN